MAPHRGPQSLRDELSEARDKVQRQLEILVAGPASNTTRWQPGSIAELQAVLDELNRRLAELGPADG